MKRSVLASFCLLPVTAQAHSPITGIGDFYNGLLHPLLVPAQLLMLLALGLLLGQLGLRSRQLGLPLFGLGLGIGLLFSGTDPRLLETALLICASVFSLLVLSALRLPLLLAGALTSGAGLLLGLDSASEPAPVQLRLATTLGTFLGASLALLLFSDLADRLQLPWQKIGTRILGSWICASALLVLALGFIQPAASKQASLIPAPALQPAAAQMLLRPAP